MSNDFMMMKEMSCLDFNTEDSSKLEPLLNWCLRNAVQLSWQPNVLLQNSPMESVLVDAVSPGNDALHYRAELLFSTNLLWKKCPMNKSPLHVLSCGRLVLCTSYSITKLFFDCFVLFRNSPH